MGKVKAPKAGDKRDGVRFVALPHVVIDSAGYRQAGHVARSLLVDLARQYTGSNNGCLVACDKYLRPLGWKSPDVVTWALRELEASGLLVKTRTGAKPNKAAWFALSWYALDQKTGMDASPEAYRAQHGAYRRPTPFDSTARRKPKKADALRPTPDVVATDLIAPSGVGPKALATTRHGAIRVDSTPCATPSHVAYLEKPSARGTAKPRLVAQA